MTYFDPLDPVTQIELKKIEVTRSPHHNGEVSWESNALERSHILHNAILPELEIYVSTLTKLFMVYYVAITISCVQHHAAKLHTLYVWFCYFYLTKKELSIRLYLLFVCTSVIYFYIDRYKKTFCYMNKVFGRN